MTSEAKEPTEAAIKVAIKAMDTPVQICDEATCDDRCVGAACCFDIVTVATAIDTAVQAERVRLRLVVTDTNDVLLELNHGDHEHIIECHADTLPELYREMAIAVEKAIDVLQIEIHAMIDPPATRDQEDAEHPESETT